MAPYFWMAGLPGDTSQFGLPTGDDVGDVLGNLEHAFMKAGEEPHWMTSTGRRRLFRAFWP
jgi:hypothetical protein